LTAAVAFRTAGPNVRRFLETFCRLSKGEWAGMPIRLRPWQIELLDDLFELRPDGLRRFRTALVGLPRKNGKSTLVAALGVFGLVADGEAGAEIYSCAGDKDQARIVFREAKEMIAADPDLSEVCKPYRDAIEGPNGGVYRVVSSDAKLRQGLNPSLVLFDELHVQPNEDLWVAMTQGSGTRRQPLTIAITTAGFDEDSLCYRLYQYGQKVLTGQVDDPAFFYRWWAAPVEMAHTDPAAWDQANPMYGDTLKPDDFETQVRITPEYEFRRYRLNQWTSVHTAWLPAGAWEGCRQDGIEPDPALPLYLGVDVGLKHDSSAVAWAQKRTDGTTVGGAWLWENPFAETDPRHQGWKLNIAELEQKILAMYPAFPVPAVDIDDDPKPGPGVYYDPMFFDRSANLLEGEGMACVEYPQNDTRMIAVSQTFYDLIVSGKFRHSAGPDLSRHVMNVIAHQKPRGWRMSKPKGSAKKIDGAIALAIAVWAAQHPAPSQEPSVYEERGLLVL
jgi:phage terminase large subunit-like protein